MALQVWETLKEAIVAYTGLSPAIFFTIAAVGLAFYYLLSSLFVSPNLNKKPRALEELVEPLPPPVQLGAVTEEELKVYDGSDPKKPLLMAIKGEIYDVSQSRMFYGPGGPYALFAGKDASRALAKMSFEEQDLTGDISGLGPFELEALQDWEYKFMSKYIKVGTIKKTATVSDETAIEKPVEATDCNGASKPVEATEATDCNGASKPVEATEVTDCNGASPGEDAEHTEDVKPAEDATHTGDVKSNEDVKLVENAKHTYDPTEEDTKSTEDKPSQSPAIETTKRSEIPSGSDEEKV